MEAFAELYSTQKESEQTRSSNWLTPHMFYYHILLHDTVNRQTAGYVRCRGQEGSLWRGEKMLGNP